MICSLVSAPTLGFDLARHPSGAVIAGILVRALSYGPAGISAVAAVKPHLDPADRAQSWDRVRAAINEVRAQSDAGQRRTLDEVIAELLDQMFFGLDDLGRLLREDVFAWTTDAVDSGAVEAAAAVFLDAIAAAWATGLTTEDQHALTRGLHAAAELVPAPRPELGPNRGRVAATLHDLAGLTADDRACLRATAATLRPTTGEWAAAMHEASWAALTTGRVRATATAQLLAAQAFVEGGLDAADAAEGVWNAVSGHVHASVMADVLPDAVAGRLSEIWRTALGAPR